MKSMKPMKPMNRTFRADYTVDGSPETLVVEVRFDDECQNSHNTFSITANLYQCARHSGELPIEHASGQRLWLAACGCLHNEIAKRLPKLAKYIKWHLCSEDRFMHYIATTVYLAGDKDCWGLRKDEFRQYTNKDGLPLWELTLKGAPGTTFLTQDRQIASAEEPAPVTLRWKPFGQTGVGKERKLDAARRSAIWPEATDEELTAPGLKERLMSRLPKLLEEFQKDMAELFDKPD